MGVVSCQWTGVAMVAIDTIYEDTYAAVRAVLSATGTGVTDPSAPRPANSEWIVSIFPESSTGGDKFPGYPILVINPLDIAGMNGVNFSKNLWRHDLIVMLELYDSDLSQLDTVSSSVMKAIRDNESVFVSTHNLHNPTVTGGRNATVEIQRKKVYYRSIFVGFDFAD